jgi:hypothetical protein
VTVSVGSASRTMSCKNGQSQPFTGLSATTHQVSACGPGCEYSSVAANTSVIFRLICVRIRNVEPSMSIAVE